VFSYATVANVGSVDEQVGATGLAHMFEHMAFKGTTRIGTRDAAGEEAALAQIDALVISLQKAQRRSAPRPRSTRCASSSRGGEAGRVLRQAERARRHPDRFGAVGINASTSSDVTTYFYSLPSNKLEVWMSLESDRFLDPVLREFYRERDVVKEERFMRIDSNPTGKLIEEFLGVAYLAHPYGRSAVGYVSDLGRFHAPEGQGLLSPVLRAEQPRGGGRRRSRAEGNDRARRALTSAGCRPVRNPSP
jgi:predicted Zn-dependent peptidase